MSFVALAGAIGAGATSIGLSGAIAGALGTTAATVAPVIGAVGAGALGGAGMGALGSAVTGGDVGKGALFGALGGGLTGGLSSAVGSIGGAAATPGAGALGSTGGTAAGAAPGAAAGSTGGSALGSTGGSALGSTTGGGIGLGTNTAINPAISQAFANTAPGMLTNPAASAASAFPTSNLAANAGQLGQVLGSTPSATGGALMQAASPYAGTLFQQYGVPIVGAGAMLGNYLGGDSGPTQATPPNQGWNPLSYYKFNPRNFYPSRPTYINPGNRYANGGIASLTSPDPAMMQSGPAKVNFMGEDAYPTSQQKLSFYSSPSQMPTSAQQAMASYEPSTNPLTGEPSRHFAGGGLLGGIPGARAIGDWMARNSIYGYDDASQIPVVGEMAFGEPQPNPGYARGGIADLGHYSDGGNLTRGPGDGVSDDIPATIAGKQPARLADGEFVVPARAVSELGNGSTEAGAKRLYAMVDQIQNKRRKSMGKKNIAVDSKARAALPV